MTTRIQRDKDKKQQDDFQATLRKLLLEEDNKYCADCDAKGPRWASWNIGVFLCIRCAGIHRNLGVHISKVKSVNLDTWTEKQINSINSLGNRCCRQVYEANLPESFRRPQTDSPLEHFIRAKYEHKKYTDKELEKTLQSRAPIIKNEPEKEKKKKPSSQEKPATLQKLAKVPLPAAPKQSPSRARIDANAFQQNKAPAVVNSAPSTPPKTQSSLDDLLGLDTPKVNNTNDLLGLAAGPQSGATLAPAPHLVASASAPSLTSLVPPTSGDMDLFGPSETTAAPSTAAQPSQTSKESILALFGNQPSTQQQQMYNVPGGLYIPSQQQPNQPQPMMNQQQGYQQQGMVRMPQQQGMVGMPQQQGMVGMPQQQGMMTMPQQQGMMTMPGGQPQRMVGMPQQQQQGMMGANMGYPGVNPLQQQQAYLQQVQAQMKNMKVADPGTGVPGQQMNGQQVNNGPAAMNGQIPQQQAAWNSAGMYPNMQQAQGVPVQGNAAWNGNMAGHTLSNQLWK